MCTDRGNTRPVANLVRHGVLGNVLGHVYCRDRLASSPNCCRVVWPGGVRVRRVPTDNDTLCRERGHQKWSPSSTSRGTTPIRGKFKENARVPLPFRTMCSTWKGPSKRATLVAQRAIPAMLSSATQSVRVRWLDLLVPATDCQATSLVLRHLQLCPVHGLRAPCCCKARCK